MKRKNAVAAEGNGNGKPTCAAGTATQPTIGIGHNGAPRDKPPSLDDVAMQLFKLIGPKVNRDIDPFQCGAPWTAHASEADLKRLGTLQARINRRAQSDKEDKAERKKIMNKNIRRMRRADGKN